MDTSGSERESCQGRRICWGNTQAVLAALYDGGLGEGGGLAQVLGRSHQLASFSMSEKEGKLDPRLMKLFIEGRCWEKTEL